MSPFDKFIGVCYILKPTHIIYIIKIVANATHVT